jgi:hypothetical protein
MFRQPDESKVYAEGLGLARWAMWKRDFSAVRPADLGSAPARGKAGA